MHRPSRALMSALALLLAGCSATPSGPAPATSGATPTGSAAEQMLQRHGLAGLSTQQVVERLDAQTSDRETGPKGSVRPDELVLSDDSGEQVSLPMPSGRFYLAMAPYITRTHECFNHNLATCQGELVDQDIHVRLVDDAGRTVLDTDLTTQANGFASTWVPKDISGRLTITYRDKGVTVPVSTTATDPTCLSEMLQLH